MKNKKIILSIIGIFAVSVILVTVVKNSTKEYIMYDGATLALTIDGSPVASFPSDSNKYYADIECDGGIGEYLPDDNYEMKFIIKSITKDGVKCNIDFTTITDSNKDEYLLKTKVESVNTTYNNGYRYSGKQPDNWVWFNNELWRIIGSIPTTLSDKVVKNRVKIIRAESVGALVYDKHLSSTWGENSLSELLNGYYYGKKDATESDSCFAFYGGTHSPLCNYTTKGISSDSNDYYGKMILDVYMYIGGIDALGENIRKLYAAETSSLTANTVKIGLMTVSDYGYSISGITYDTQAISDSGEYHLKQNSWLNNQMTEWTMTPGNKYYKAITIGNQNACVNNLDVSNSYIVRPAVYLDPDVYIISGDGTESNPYVLGL